MKVPVIPAEAPALTVDAVTVRFAGLTALDAVSFAVAVTPVNSS